VVAGRVPAESPGTQGRRTIANLLSAQEHQRAVGDLPLDILLAAARDPAQPIEIRLAAAKAAAPYFHAKVSNGPPKASFEMTLTELKIAIAREKEYLLRAGAQQRTLRVVAAVTNRALGRVAAPARSGAGPSHRAGAVGSRRGRARAGRVHRPAAGNGRRGSRRWPVCSRCRSTI
jgi:hypothetical protein